MLVCISQVRLLWILYLFYSWGRHVKLRTISGLLRAEVIYITPAGRKLRTYGEVERALEVMDTDMTKENFSFSNKLQVGTFFLPCESQVPQISTALTDGHEYPYINFVCMHGFADEGFLV